MAAAGTQPLALVASRIGFEEKLILAELERRGVPYEQVDTRRLWLDLGTAAPFAFAGVLNREISLTRSLYVARLLDEFGVRAVNPLRAIETCGDKLLTSLALSRAGLPIPRTAVALTTAAAGEALRRIGYPAVIKPLVGSWGRLLALVRDPDAAAAVLEHRDALPTPQQRIVYLQELVDKPQRDIRLIVVGDEPLGAIHRACDGWRTNTALGAVASPRQLDSDLAKLGVEAARAVGGEVVGVDLIEDRDGGLHLLEVNHRVEFRGFHAAFDGAVDVAGAIVSHLVRRLERR